MPITTFTERAAPTPVSAASSGGGISALYIIGFCIAGAVFLALAIWLSIYFYRKRVVKKRQDGMGSAFLSVRGLVKDGEPYPEKKDASSVVLFFLVSLRPD
jgi:hypothetical protein